MENLKRFYKSLEVKKRDNGDEFVYLADDAPEWTKILARQAHGDMMPNDTRYDMILECVEAMLEYEEISTDNVHEIADGLVDIYTHELMKWMGSHGLRVDYIDNAQNDGLLEANSTMFERMTIGQFCEYEEILSVLISTFEDMEGDE